MTANPFAHHTRLDELDRDWLARRSALSPWWDHREERARLAIQRDVRADELRK